MSLSIIRSALQGRLAQWNALQTPPYAIAWENVKFEPPAGLYLRFNLMPADTTSADLAGAHRAYLGVAQITIMERLDVSTAGSEALAAEIVALYPLYEYIGDVMVYSPPTVARGFPDGSRYVLPVSFRYRMDTI